MPAFLQQVTGFGHRLILGGKDHALKFADAVRAERLVFGFAQEALKVYHTATARCTLP